MILTSAIWLTQCLRYVDVIVNKGLPVTDFFRLTVLLLPDIFGVVLPFSLFISILFIYNKLEQDHELIVFRSTGMSNFQLSVPTFLLTAVVFALLLFVHIIVMPRSLGYFKDTEHGIRNASASLFLQEQTFTTFDKTMVFVRSQKQGKYLEGIVVNEYKTPQEQMTLVAERGYIQKGSDVTKLILMNGVREYLSEKSIKPELIYFDEYTVNLTTAKPHKGLRDRKIYEMSLSELFFPKHIRDGHHWKLLAEGHKRIITPLLALLFGLIAVTGIFYGEFNRRGRSKKIMMAVLATSFSQLFVLWFLNMADRLHWTIYAAYAYIFAGILFCFFMLMSDKWETGLRRQSK